MDLSVAQQTDIKLNHSILTNKRSTTKSYVFFGPNKFYTVRVVTWNKKASKKWCFGQQQKSTVA